MAGGIVKVYGSAVSPYVATVLVCLEEAGAAYELVPVDMAARENKAPHHLARNVRTPKRNHLSRSSNHHLSNLFVHPL